MDKKEVFKERHKDIYRYEVHRGLHGVRARQALLAENPSLLSFSMVHAIVFVGLTDREALRLASRHNINGHYNHKMTNHDYMSDSQTNVTSMHCVLADVNKVTSSYLN